MTNRNGFDYQLIRIIDCQQKQPDLKKMVRLFFDRLPFWIGFLLNMKKHFAVFHVAEKEALLGSNHNRYEVRLSFYTESELPGRIILCFAISHLNLIGYFQSLYIRLIFRFLLPSLITSLKVYDH